MKNLVLIALVLPLTACVAIKPVKIHSDPNQERLERTEEKVERDNIEAFIAEHPELDADMRKALREGTLSRAAALDAAKRAKLKNSHPK
jgi:hypothetical protein